MSRMSTGMDLMVHSVLLLLASGVVADTEVVNGTLGNYIYFNESLSDPGLLLQWSFKGNLIASRYPSLAPGYNPDYGGRCQMYDDGTLRLDNLTSADDGTYRFNALQPPATTVKDVYYELRVYHPVSDVKLTSNISGVVWPGLDLVSLTCSANGTGVTYSWNLQGAPLPSDSRYHFTENNGVLTISPVTAKDNGTFTCRASNWINNQTSNGLNLVLGSLISVVTLTTNTSGSYIWVGEDSVSLNCSADGSDVQFLWKLNGIPLSSGYQYHISQGGSPPHSNLLISPVSKNDAGPFTCEASNRLNSKTSNALNLSLNWTPEGNIACTALPDGQDIKLGCSWSGGHPEANVSLIFNGITENGTNSVNNVTSIDDNFQVSDLTCHGDQLGRKSQCTVRIGPPLAIGHDDNNTITDTKVGGSLNLTVTLEYGLPATFTWNHTSSSQSKESIQSRESSVSSTDFSSSYMIRDLTVKDAGKYECKAENLIGTQSFIFTVSVTENVAPTDGLSGGAIAGIVIGVLAGVILIGIAVFFIVKKTDIGRNKIVSEPEYHPETQENQTYVNVPEQHIYATTLPGTKGKSQESHYEQLAHNDKSIYSNMAPTARKY